MTSAVINAVDDEMVPAVDARARWSYGEAFKRNRGLITEKEQEKLRNSCVAIAGMGGVGGVHLVTLARLGIGKFAIADPDVFEVANFNRQHGATISNLGRNKAEAMADAALDINPDLNLRVIPEAVDESNVDEFLDGADLFVDGLDFFAIEARRLVFRRAAERGIWAITAGPIGFSTAWLVFDPNGMAFDHYFDLHDRMHQLDQLIAFAVGLAPRATHRSYTDLSSLSLAEQNGPSAALACQLASGAMASEAMKVLLHWGRLRTAPAYSQFDAHLNCLRKGRLGRGNAGLIQKLKRTILKRRLRKKLEIAASLQSNHHANSLRPSRG
jgi:molybdopterin/thiamine biosynthesis adenylyltransferase